MIWEKFICNVTYSGPCALVNATIGKFKPVRKLGSSHWCAKEADAASESKEHYLG